MEINGLPYPQVKSPLVSKEQDAGSEPFAPIAQHAAWSTAPSAMLPFKEDSSAEHW
jgi:hypothetical protein